MKSQSYWIKCIVVLMGITLSVQTASARSRTPWIAKQRAGNPDGPWLQAHLANLNEKEAMSRVDWVMFGDGLTADWATTGKELLDRQFYRRNILNLGVEGDMTQDMLWRLAHGEVYGIKPKLITVMVGRENITSSRGISTWVGRSDGKMLAGIKAVVEDLQKRCPGARIVLLSNLHRGAVAGDSILANIEETNMLIKKHEKIRRYNEAEKIDFSFVLKRIDWMNNQLAGLCKDVENLTYLDLNKSFLDEQGGLDKSLFMEDQIRLNAGGYEVWAKALAPVVQEVLGNLPEKHAANTPVPRGGGIHQQDLADKNAMKQVDLVFVGDSITHAWDTVPDLSVSPRGGKRVWNKFYGKRRALNYGQGGDRTHQTLWRVQNGIFDGISPKLVVLMMGVNNLGRKECTPEETADGLEAILDEIHRRCPDSPILHLATFPLGEQPYSGERKRIEKLNSHLPALAKKKNKEWGKELITFMSINDKLLNKDRTINKDCLHDFCHPSEHGYQVWADSIEPVVERYLGKLE